MRPPLVSDHFTIIRKFCLWNHFTWNLSQATTITFSVVVLQFSIVSLISCKRPLHTILPRYSLKICSADRDDHKETPLARRGTIRTVSVTPIVWIKQSSIRTIGEDCKPAITWNSLSDDRGDQNLSQRS